MWQWGQITEGSSPPARGARATGTDRRRVTGIIPACAGSTSLTARLPPSVSDHPRLRGEHLRRRPRLMAEAGSSPPARGARSSGNLREVRYRIIPACAGSTTSCGRGCHEARDHPRLRGEHGDRSGLGHVISGSSPPARGAQRRAWGTLPVHRIIPACAGSTGGWAVAGASPRDHPRLRGEHSSRVPGVGAERGSSPPARGAHAVAGRRRRRHRIIPACAGSTDHARILAVSDEDHPRLRGEHVGDGDADVW